MENLATGKLYRKTQLSDEYGMKLLGMKEDKYLVYQKNESFYFFEVLNEDLLKLFKIDKSK